jgi:glycosyltransferase involved in cell wall biosynthesis
MMPLVSVLMPCYNSARTLPRAIASLLAQTHDEWECIFVDDGSTDCSTQLIRAVPDCRIKCFRFEKNLGRGAARRFAVEQARGTYVCMLDADDWLYPRKIETQVSFMQSTSGVAVISAGMAIMDRAGDLAGVRVPRDSVISGAFVRKPMRRLQMPPLAFAPSLFRMAVLRDHNFDVSFPTVEDVDLLLRVVLRYSYASLYQPMYAYSEYATVTLQKLLEGSHFSRRMFLKHYETHPSEAILNCLKVTAKSCVYRGAYTVNRSDWLISRRSRDATVSEAAEFASARETIDGIVGRIFN